MQALSSSCRFQSTTWTRGRFPCFSYKWHSGGGVVVKLFAFATSGRGPIPGLAATISEIGYLLLRSRHIADMSLKRLKLDDFDEKDCLKWY